MTLQSIHIRHFQSLRDVSLELSPFTVIVGPSSSGKSAFTRALRTLVSNRRGTEWITHGERVATITATTNAGTVTLTRSKSTMPAENSYIITPNDNTPHAQKGQQTYTKLGGETPEPVSKFIGITSPTITFAGQFDKPFLLDDSAAEVARTLGTLTNVDIILSGARESNRRKLETSHTLKTRSADLEDIKARIPAFKALKAQDAALMRAEGLISRARTLERAIARLQDSLGILETLEPIIPQLTRRASVTVPDETSILQASRALRRFERALTDISAQSKAIKASQANYDAVDAQEAEIFHSYETLTADVTEDLRTFFNHRVDPKYTVTDDGVLFVESGHAVEVFLNYLETNSGV